MSLELARLPDAKAVDKRAIPGRCFGYDFFLSQPIGPYSGLLQQFTKRRAASSKLFVTEKTFFVLAEVVFHCNHCRTALVMELPLSDQFGRGCAAIAFYPSRGSVGVHQSKQKRCGSGRSPLMD